MHGMAQKEAFSAVVILQTAVALPIEEKDY